MNEKQKILREKIESLLLIRKIFKWSMIIFLVCMVACGLFRACFSDDFDMSDLCITVLCFFCVLLFHDYDNWLDQPCKRKFLLDNCSTSESLETDITFENELTASQTTLMEKWNEPVSEHHENAENQFQIKTNGQCQDMLVGQYSLGQIEMKCCVLDTVKCNIQGSVEDHVYNLFRSKSLPALHLSLPVKKPVIVLDHFNESRQTVKNRNKNREKVNVIGFGKLSRSKVPVYKKINAGGLNDLIGLDLKNDALMALPEFNNNSALMTQRNNHLQNLDGEVSAGLGSYLALVGDHLDLDYTISRQLLRGIKKNKGAVTLTCVSALMIGVIVIKRRL